MAEVEPTAACQSRRVRVDRVGTSPDTVNADDVFVVKVLALPLGADVDEWGGPPTEVESEATFETVAAALDAVRAMGVDLDRFRSYWSFGRPG
jgi:hypothetical protein